MDEKKKYAAFSLPRREEPPTPDLAAPAQIRPVEIDLSTDVPFAEIEYEVAVSHAFSPAPAQKIGARTVDPIREKFFTMRSLAAGTPFSRNDPALFYRQAKYMEGFEDNYPGNALLSMYYPCYQHMGYVQLRTYFTWRTHVRRGSFLPISLSYLFVYIYELLNGIGVTDADDGLEKLLSVWNAYREVESALDSYIPGWLKDYHIYYDLPHSFMETVRTHNLQRYYLDSLILDADAEDSFAIFCGLSSYDTVKSKFYAGGNEALTKDCFHGVFTGVQELLTHHNLRVSDLLTHGSNRKMIWYPFGRALFYPWLSHSDREVEMAGQERYFCKGDQWSVIAPGLDYNRKEWIGYLLKKTEACLRQTVKYKYKITANPYLFGNFPAKLKSLGLSISELDATIEKAVTDFHKNLNRTVVVVDTASLNRIRNEALKTQDKLIVPEADTPLPLPMPKQTEVYSPPPDIFPQDSDGWAAFKGALSQTELTALRLILHGSGDIRSFADENGIMLEVLADNINEKAADHIGDSIMEFTDEMMLYDEYKDKIAEMVG